MLVCGWMHGRGKRKRCIDDWGWGGQMIEFPQIVSHVAPSLSPSLVS